MDAGAPAASADVRATPEYAAAWDLELWKQQQRRKFALALDEERAAVVAELERKAGDTQRRRDAEYRARHEQVERLAQRVARSLDVLRKREDRIQQREQELERKRAALARDWEQKVMDCDERIRRATEEGYFAAQASKTRAQELAELNEALQRKNDRVQGEYEKLCAEFTKWRQEHLAARPAGAPEGHEELLAKEKDARERAERERDAALAKLRRAQAQSRRYRRQLVTLAEEHNRLLQHAYRERVESLNRERDALERAQALHAAAAVRAERAQEAGQLRATAPGTQHAVPASEAARACTATQPGAVTPSSGAVHTAAAAELRELIAQAEERLRAESAAGSPTRREHRDRHVPARRSRSVPPPAVTSRPPSDRVAPRPLPAALPGRWDADARRPLAASPPLCSPPRRRGCPPTPPSASSPSSTGERACVSDGSQSSDGDGGGPTEAGRRVAPRAADELGRLISSRDRLVSTGALTPASRCIAEMDARIEAIRARHRGLLPDAGSPPH
eukprot:TRINITY_DN12019_c0_g1_i1.p1 TRINITY_DN12019_c0_g1~~TRINITY_DN12019_c0_g1_i1.p1  ORF type:complete len:507 (+),score=129.27 TRINITY_DN12019_c0_g1_i1:90-1610(+)